MEVISGCWKIENVPWIDEKLNPFTGDWIFRTRLKSLQKEVNKPVKIDWISRIRLKS